MKTKIISILLCISIIGSFFCFIAPRAKAVVPVGLGAAVVFSYLWSTGIELWREGSGEYQSPQAALESAIEDLWSKFRTANNGEYPSLEELSGSVSFDQFGRAIVTNQIAIQLNDFVNWFKEKYNASPNSTISITENSGSGSGLGVYYTVSQDVSSQFQELDKGVWALPVGATSGTPPYTMYVSEGVKYQEYFGFDAGVKAICYTDGSNRRLCICSSVPFTGTRNYYSNSGAISSQISIGDSSADYVPGLSGPLYVYTDSLPSGFTIQPVFPFNNISTIRDTAATREMVYVVLYGTRVGTAVDIFAKIGQTILDNVYDSIQDQSVALDIGLTGAEENEQESFVVAAADAFVAGDDAALGYSSVATPVPVEGVQELYPTADDIITDVEGLGVPTLGHALATRFPFCIPFDINYLFKSLSASPKQPVFEVDVIPQSLKSKIGITQNKGFTVDFGDSRYALLIKLIRWATLFGFILWLALMTKRLIWTSGG